MISKIQSIDKDEIIFLHEKYLNYGDGVKTYIDGIFNTNSFFGYKFVDNSKIQGIALIEKGIVFTVPHPEIEQKIFADAGGCDVYSLASYIVEENYRGKHIGRELILACINDLKKNGRDSRLIVEMWVYPDKNTPANFMINIMDSHKDYGIIPDFYADECLYGFNCPICGDKCRCSAKLEMFSISGQQQ